MVVGVRRTRMVQEGDEQKRRRPAWRSHKIPQIGAYGKSGWVQAPHIFFILNISNFFCSFNEIWLGKSRPVYADALLRSCFSACALFDNRKWTPLRPVMSVYTVFVGGLGYTYTCEPPNVMNFLGMCLWTRSGECSFPTTCYFSQDVCT